MSGYWKWSLFYVIYVRPGTIIPFNFFIWFFPPLWYFPQMCILISILLNTKEDLLKTWVSFSMKSSPFWYCLINSNCLCQLLNSESLLSSPLVSPFLCHSLEVLYIKLMQLSRSFFCHLPGITALQSLHLILKTVSLIFCLVYGCCKNPVSLTPSWSKT